MRRDGTNTFRGRMRGDSVRVQDKKDVITTISKFEFFESDDNDD